MRLHCKPPHSHSSHLPYPTFQQSPAATPLRRSCISSTRLARRTWSTGLRPTAPTSYTASTAPAALLTYELHPSTAANQPSQAGHVSGKPGNVREFNGCQEIDILSGKSPENVKGKLSILYFIWSLEIHQSLVGCCWPCVTYFNGFSCLLIYFENFELKFLVIIIIITRTISVVLWSWLREFTWFMWWM